MSFISTCQISSQIGQIRRQIALSDASMAYENRKDNS